MREKPQIQAAFDLGSQIEARGRHPEVAGWPLLRTDDRIWTYGEYRDECVRLAHFLRRRLGGPGGHVAMLLENHAELLTLLGACGYNGSTLFGINTGLRGETLSGVINQSRATVLVVDERLQEQVERVRDQLDHIAPENVLVVRTSGAGGELIGPELGAAVTAEIGASGVALERPEGAVAPEQPLMVIYTSGTTGLPKGILNNHAKLLLIGMAVSGNMELTPEDVGYACMPLFHSNAIFLGFMPTFTVGGSLALRERFSASRFVPDVLHHGVTYWNYVGEPVHYVLGALEKEFGSTERLRAEVTTHPRNRMRFALGNGAAPPDIERFIDWLGLDDMFELYGSTEAAISTFRRKTDPRGSVGEITDLAVKIISERGAECPSARLDAEGKIANYAEAVGEICRVAPDTSLFQGYFENQKANTEKYRDGVYHSGDLGHILDRDGKRFLFFDGRTDDWIRKDGENFSALQVARVIQEHPDIVLAAAYGVPCAVSDELVMVALKLRAGASFDPAAFFGWCENQVNGAGMDRKWFPDFVRIVPEFEYTQTEKILVRNLKKVHFDPRRTGSDPVLFRQRGDRAYAPLDEGAWQALRERYAAAEKLDLLDR